MKHLKKLDQLQDRLSMSFKYIAGWFVVVQSLSPAQICNPLDCSMPGSSDLHCLSEFAQIHVHRVCKAISPSHPLSPTFAFAFPLSMSTGHGVHLSPHSVCPALSLARASSTAVTEAATSPSPPPSFYGFHHSCCDSHLLLSSFLSQFLLLLPSPAPDDHHWRAEPSEWAPLCLGREDTGTAHYSNFWSTFWISGFFFNKFDIPARFGSFSDVRSSPETLEWEHWLQDPRIAEN